ncbi:hypothetical protein D3C71_865310 [compost metagenome]
MPPPGIAPLRLQLKVVGVGLVQVQPLGRVPVPVKVKPFGSTPATVTPLDDSGPRLSAVRVKVTAASVAAGAGAATMLRVTSAPVVIRVSAVAASLSGRGSGVPTATTRAALVTVPLATLALARKLKVAVWPLASAPAWVAVVLPALNVQPLPLKLPATTLKPAGRVSITRKLVELLGPRLRTARV